MKKINIFLLALLPLILVFIGFFLKSILLSYYTNIVDPEYAYLFSGLNLAHLNFPWHVDHPGTPLQVLSAIVIRIVHFFHQNNIPLNNDIFTNPELFLNAINITLIILNAAALFVSGYLIYKVTKRLIIGIFFQLTPFVSYTVLTALMRVNIENILIFTVICFVLIVVLFLNEQKDKPGIIDKYLILFSLIIGFGISVKITFFPLFFIPFMLIPGIKKKSNYALFSFISFCVFAFPIFRHPKYFSNWVVKLFIHSGHYGVGPSNIVDSNSFFENIKTIFSTENFFPVVFIIIIIACLIYHLPFLRVKEKNDNYYKALLGVALTMLLQIVIIAKQFKYYYLEPSLLLMIFGLYLVFSIYSRQIKFLKKDLFVIPLLLIFMFCTYHFEVKKYFDYHKGDLFTKEAHLKTMDFIDKNYDKNTPTLVVPNYYGAPYKAYGLYFGMGWCGPKMGEKYTPFLREQYPNIYFYHSWNNLFNNHWGDSFSFVYLLKKYQKVNFFSGDPDLENSLNTKFHGINRQIDTKFKKVYNNESTKETLYEVSYDSTAANK